MKLPRKLRFKNANGFSLVEVMVTIVIVGVLATVGMISYWEYLKKIRLAEAMNVLNVLSKAEVIYYSTNKHFISFYSPVASNGHNIDSSRYVAIPSGGEKYRIDSTAPSPSNYTVGEISNSARWKTLGLPLADGTNISFLYSGFAIKTNASKQQSIDSTGGFYTPFINSSGGVFGNTLLTGMVSPVGGLKGCVDYSLQERGSQVANFANKDWVILGAAANFNTSVDDLNLQVGGFPYACTYVVKFLETNTSGQVTTGGAPAVVNMGH